MDNAQDVIQAALDNMGKRVELLINDGTDLRVRFATVTGYKSLGEASHLKLADYSNGHELICVGTVVLINEIIDIREAS